MTETQYFDNVIIGGGSGMAAAYYALRDGQSVALVTDRPNAMGGTCVNFGCIPTKTLIASAHAAEAVRDAAQFGIHVDMDTLRVDFAGIMRDMRKRRTENTHDVRDWVERAMSPFYSRARFIGDKLLETADGQRVSGDKIFIASGARPTVPSIEGLEAAGYWTNEDVLELSAQPASVIIIGGGYIGAELGYFFSALGTEVTVIDPCDTLLSEDDDVCALFTRVFARHARLVTGEVVRVSARDDGKAVEVEIPDGDTRIVKAEQILLAVGRTPNTEALDLPKTGVEVDANGAIKVDDFLRTDHPDIYAYGDVIGKGPFKHTSSAEAELAYYNAQGANRHMEYGVNPHAVFSDPEVAAVGLTERECRERGLDYRVARAEYCDCAKGKIIGAADGFAKLLVENGGECKRILGCHIVGPHAALLLHEVVVAMNAESLAGKAATANVVRRAIHIHPSLAELIGTLFCEI